MGWCSMRCTWSDDTLHGTPRKDCRWTCNRMGSMDNLEVRIMEGDVQAGIEFIYHMREHLVDIGVATVYGIAVYTIVMWIRRKLM